jgi:hypothetical protein
MREVCVLTLFEADIEPWRDQYRATCVEFPLNEGYGETPEDARNSLARIIIEFYKRP